MNKLVRNKISEIIEKRTRQTGKSKGVFIMRFLKTTTMAIFFFAFISTSNVFSMKKDHASRKEDKRRELSYCATKIKEAKSARNLLELGPEHLVSACFTLGLPGIEYDEETVKEEIKKQLRFHSERYDELEKELAVEYGD